MNEIAPLEIARVEVTLKIMGDGRRAVGFVATTPEAETPSLLDLHGMLSFAQAMITDPEWLAEAYEPEDEQDTP